MPEPGPKPQPSQPVRALRERLVAELVSRLAGNRLLGVVGASGSGKSSALRAGLLASLADDVLREAHRLGLTGVHSVEVTGIEDFAAMEQDGELRLRVLQAIPLVRLDQAIAVGLRSGFGSDWLRIGGVKMFLDGALGSRTAWMRQPYEGGAAGEGVGERVPKGWVGRAAVRIVVALEEHEA